MKCEQMEEQLVSLLYGEIDEEEAKRIKAHLKSCASCRKVYKELQGTTEILDRWEVESPKLNFVFVRHTASWWSGIKERIAQMGWGRRLAVGVPALALLFIVSLALFNFRASYEQGSWNFSFSLAPQKQAAFNEAQLAELLRQSQDEMLILMAKMIDESESRQRRESTLTLAQFAQTLERQRKEDLRMMGQGLEGLYRTTEGGFIRTNEVLSDLIRQASLKVDRK